MIRTTADMVPTVDAPYSARGHSHRGLSGHLVAFITRDLRGNAILNSPGVNSRDERGPNELDQPLNGPWRRANSSLDRGLPSGPVVGTAFFSAGGTGAAATGFGGGGAGAA